jgi:2-keto-4-pentenoate hydratase/2-oxohepta-3-ene-1,7-dioic acid hydratase in catechol pathway
MQLASFAVATDVGSIRRVGVARDGELLDVTAGYAHILDREGEATPTEVAQTLAPPDMTTFLRRGERAMDAAREVAETVPDADAERGPDGARLVYDESEVELLSPLPRPNTLRDFMAFEEHVKNTMGEVPDIWYEMPVGYKSNPESVVGPGATVDWPDYSDQLDIELEIAAVIGREGRNIDADEADDYIAGYTIFNDFSARDTQLEEMQGQLGPAKGKDFANALGPYLVTPEEFDLESATFTAEVSGEVWSEGTVGEMGHSFAEIIQHASDHEWLRPGDVLGSGTVGTGCGLELGTFLDDGDTTKLTVEGLGTLTNTVVQS